MILGKSIRIYLKDGTVTGIKFGEVVNQTIQSISCPRNRIAELSNYLESKRPAIYFLLGFDEILNEPKAYIGEAENVFDRLQKHLAEKGFWNEVIFFVSKDENLTKSHVKFLESRAIQIALLSNRYKIENYNQSQLPSLPPADRDAMEEFLVYVKLLLGILGHKLLEEVAKIPVKQVLNTSASSIPSIPHLNVTETESSAPEYLELSLNVKGYSAKSIMTDEGIVVLKGSEAALKYQPGLQIGYKELREKLIANGTLVIQGNKMIFENDYLFDTASPAASVIVGYSINGREYWKDKNNISLKALESKSKL